MCKDEEVFLGKFCLLWSNSLTENYLSQWVNILGFLCWPKDPLTPLLPFVPASDFTIHQRKRRSKRFIINLILWSLSSRSLSFLGMGCQNVGWWWCICKDEEIFLGKCCLLWSNNSVYTFGKKMISFDSSLQVCCQTSSRRAEGLPLISSHSLFLVGCPI